MRLNHTLVALAGVAFGIAFATIAAAQTPVNHPAVQAQPVQAQPVNPLPLTGAELARSIRVCEKAGVTVERISDWRACAGYLAGLINGATAMADLLGSAPLICIPDTVGDAALLDGIADYVEAHAATAAAPTPAAVIEAAITLYSCKRPS